MTPEEKAKELIKKHQSISVTVFGCSDGSNPCIVTSFILEKDAAQFALLAVDEINNVGCWVSQECAEKEGFGVESTEEFWIEVKRKLEKL